MNFARLFSALSTGAAIGLGAMPDGADPWLTWALVVAAAVFGVLAGESNPTAVGLSKK